MSDKYEVAVCNKCGAAKGQCPHQPTDCPSCAALRQELEKMRKAVDVLAHPSLVGEKIRKAVDDLLAAPFPALADKENP